MHSSASEPPRELTPSHPFQRRTTGRRLLALLGLALAVGALGGCQPSPTDRLIGRWEGSVEVNQAEAERRIEAEDSPLKQQMGRFLLGGLKSMKMTLAFQADGQMAMSVVAGPVQQTRRATWELVEHQGDRLTLRSVDEKGNEQQFVVVFTGPDSFVLESGGDHPAARLGSLTFRRIVE